jgi:hypothetical protein
VKDGAAELVRLLSAIAVNARDAIAAIDAGDATRLRLRLDDHQRLTADVERITSHVARP